MINIGDVSPLFIKGQHHPVMLTILQALLVLIGEVQCVVCVCMHVCMRPTVAARKYVDLKQIINCFPWDGGYEPIRVLSFLTSEHIQLFHSNCLPNHTGVLEIRLQYLVSNFSIDYYQEFITLLIL